MVASLQSLDLATKNIALTADIMNNLMAGLLNFHVEKYKKNEDLTDIEKSMTLALIQRTDDTCKKTFFDTFISTSEYSDLADWVIKKNRPFMQECKEYVCARW